MSSWQNPVVCKSCGAANSGDDTLCVRCAQVPAEAPSTAAEAGEEDGAAESLSTRQKLGCALAICGLVLISLPVAWFLPRCPIETCLVWGFIVGCFFGLTTTPREFLSFGKETYGKERDSAGGINAALSVALVPILIPLITLGGCYLIGVIVLALCGAETAPFSFDTFTGSLWTALTTMVPSYLVFYWTLGRRRIAGQRRHDSASGCP